MISGPRIKVAIGHAEALRKVIEQQLSVANGDDGVLLGRLCKRLDDILRGLRALHQAVS